MSRVCTVCHFEKDNYHFSPDRRSKSGLQSRCKQCSLEWQRLYRKTGISPYSVKRSMPKRSKSPLWRGGYVALNGYRTMMYEGKISYEHRYIMEKILGRKLNSWEHVHHMDGNKTNNSPDNLRVISASEHQRIHHLGVKHA